MRWEWRFPRHHELVIPTNKRFPLKSACVCVCVCVCVCGVCVCACVRVCVLICDVSYMASAKPHPATLGYRQWRKAKICLKSPMWLHFQVKYSMMFNKHRPVSILPLFSKSYKSSCIIDLCLSSIRTSFCLKISLSLENKVAQILLLLLIWVRLCQQSMMEKLCWGIFQFK